MLKKILSKNLKKPGYFFRKKISELFKANIIVYEEHEKYIKMEHIEKAFEIGYGPGYGIENYCSKYKINIEGIDFSKGMFSIAKKRNCKYIKEKRVKLYLGNFDKLVPNDNKYDLVYLFNVIYFWSDPESYFYKIFRMVNEKGMISIFMDSAEVIKNNKNIDKSIFHTHKNDYIISLLKKVGFKDIIEIESSSFSGSFFIIGSKKI